MPAALVANRRIEATEDDPAGAPPANRCLLHAPPRPPRGWALADEGYRTCSGCLARVREGLREVAERWQMLDPIPGDRFESGGRGAPGFGSRSPGSDHIIAMRDRRSTVIARVWVGADGRIHAESTRPPLPVVGALAQLAHWVADARGLRGPDRWGEVDELVRWLDGQLDWVTRFDGVVAFAAVVRALVSQLRPVTGEPGAKRIGRCPNVLDEGEHTRECAEPLYAPLRGDEIRCRACGRRWPREEWLALGRTLQVAS